MHPVSAVARCFERRFLFGYGRHFWNAVGVAGFALMATGGVLALNPLIVSLKESRRQDTSFSYYVINIECRQLGKTFMHSNQVDLYSQLSGKSLDCWLYRRWQQLGNGRQQDFRVTKGFTIGYWREVLPAERRLKTRYIQWKSGTDNTQILNPALSLPLAWSGLSLVAVSSLLAAILSIERNTRND